MFYYSRSGKTFLSKVDALVDSNDPALYYFDHEYSRVLWSKEPTETLPHLYLEQASRLRAKYDYLILCYSGGYDSTNILETFHYSGIPLDKIVTVGAFSQDEYSGSDANHNGELYRNAFPLIEKLGYSPITERYDYTQLFKGLSINTLGSDWVDSFGSRLSPHNWFWRDIEKFVVPKNVQSEKVGLIFGKDKPNLDSSGKFRFVDTAITSYGNLFGTENCDRINFYWDPTFPKVLVKQLHTIKNLRDAGRPAVHPVDSLVYNLRNPLLYKSQKSSNTSVSLRDQYLYKTAGSEVNKLFLLGMQRLTERLGYTSMKPVYSRFYQI